MSIIGTIGTSLRFLTGRWSFIVAQEFGRALWQTWARSESNVSSRAVNVSIRRVK
jgi:hypothetical protein